MSINLYAQFKAKMVYNSMGKERVYTVYSDDEGYRYEFNEDGQEGVFISEHYTRNVIILMPQQKTAMKSMIGSAMTSAIDPLKAYELYPAGDNLVIVGQGKETINEVLCKKSELWNKYNDEYGKVNQKLFSVWYSEKYKFTIKIINHIDGTDGSVMELKDIEPWTPDANSFSIPEGYQIMEMGGMK